MTGAPKIEDLALNIRIFGNNDSTVGENRRFQGGPEPVVAGHRDFAISPQLANICESSWATRKEGLLFVSRTGRPWRKSKVVEKRLRINVAVEKFKSSLPDQCFSDLICSSRFS
jgi:hypothetical protein